MSVEAKQQKQAVIDEIKAKLEGAEAVVLIDYMGTTVAQADAMRKELRENDIDYTVYKNTLMKRAIAGTEFEPLGDAMEGPSAIAISKTDATAPGRLLKKAMKDFNKMEFKAGVVEGTFYNKEQIEQLASIPSREELLAKFLGSIQSPVSKFVRRLAAIAEAEGQEAPWKPPQEAPAEEAPAKKRRLKLQNSKVS